jgi:hypothetical protein
MYYRIFNIIYRVLLGKGTLYREREIFKLQVDDIILP